MASDCMSLILWDLTNALVICGKKNKRIHCDREKISFCEWINRINVISQRFFSVHDNNDDDEKNYIVYKLPSSYRYRVLYIGIKKMY